MHDVRDYQSAAAIFAAAARAMMNCLPGGGHEPPPDCFRLAVLSGPLEPNTLLIAPT